VHTETDAYCAVSPLLKRLAFFFFFFFGGAGVCKQGLMLAKQVFYHLSHFVIGKAGFALISLMRLPRACRP
jgi:hypothetical protein